MGSDSSKPKNKKETNNNNNNHSTNNNFSVPSIRLPASQSCYDVPSKKEGLSRSRPGSSCSVSSRHPLNPRHRRLIQSCFANPHETIGRRIMKRAAEVREDFGRFYLNMDAEQREIAEEAIKAVLKKIIACLESAEDMQRVAEEYGTGFVELRPLGFKPDYFAVIADATITECTHLDSAVHKAHTTTHAFSQFGAMMFSSVRDGFYHEVRKRRRTSNSFSCSSNNSSVRRKKSGDSRTSSRGGSPRPVSPELFGRAQTRMAEPVGCSCKRVCLIAFQIARWFPVLFVFAILGWAYYAYVVNLCIESVESIPQKALYLVLFHILLALLVTSYLRTVFARVRRPPKEFKIPAAYREEIAGYNGEIARIAPIVQRYVEANCLPVYMREYEGRGGGYRFCPKCIAVKPDRSHHCSFCGTCVLKFDHHCPWVNTCVNFHNYKFFLLFLGYGLVFCIFCVATDLEFFVRFWRHDFLEGRGDSIKINMVMLFFVGAMFSISMGGLFFYHLYLVAKNRTTIESFRAPILTDGPNENAFNLGIRNNFRQVFGNRPLLWLLPVFTSQGDGLRFSNLKDEVPIHDIPVSPKYAEANGVDVYGDGIVFGQRDLDGLSYTLLARQSDEDEDLIIGAV
ncbi:unnamed protein product, partial [Mesorhabditis spiculigera]